MFYANWCPHCTAMVNTWKTLHQKYGREFSVLAIDCASGGAKIQQICAQLGVQGYPTIKVWNRGRLTDYNGSRELPALEAALRRLKAPTPSVMSGGHRRRKSSRKPRKSTRRRRRTA